MDPTILILSIMILVALQIYHVILDLRLENKVLKYLEKVDAMLNNRLL